MGEHIVASGGWCVTPAWLGEVTLDAGAYGLIENFPVVSVQRGDFGFPRPGSPEWREAQLRSEMLTSLRAMIQRRIGDIDEAIRIAIDTVANDAREMGMGVLLERPPYGHYPTYELRPYRFVGLEITDEVPRGYIWERVAESYWDEDD